MRTPPTSMLLNISKLMSPLGETPGGQTIPHWGKTWAAGTAIRAQSEVELTPGEIKAKTPRIPRIREKVFHPILGQVAPVETYHLPGLLNLWNPWNPWRFCFLAQFALQAAGKGPETGRPAIARLPVPSGTEVVRMLDFTSGAMYRVSLAVDHGSLCPKPAVFDLRLLTDNILC